MPRSLNLPQAILAIALHAAGRPLLTQELAVLAGKPQEAIASLLEPLLGAGFVAHTEAPDAWVCPGLPDAVRDEFVRLLIRNAPPPVNKSDRVRKSLKSRSWQGLRLKSLSEPG